MCRLVTFTGHAGYKSVKYISKHIKLQQSFGPAFDLHKILSIYVEQTCFGMHSLQVES